MPVLIALALIASSMTPGRGRTTVRSAPRQTLFVAIMLGASLLGFVLPDDSRVALGGVLYIALLSCAPIIIFGLHRSTLRDTLRFSAGDPITWAIVLTAWLFLRDVAAVGIDPKASLAYVSSLLLLCCLRLIRGATSLDPGIVSRMFAIFLGIGLVVGFVLGRQWIPCPPDKCSLVGHLYRGIFPSENTVAMFAALAGAFTLAAPKSTLRLVRLTSLFAVVAISGGRSSAAGLAAACIIPYLLTTAVATKRTTGSWRLPGWVGVSASLTILAGALLLLSHAKAGDLSGRGTIWVAAIKQVGIRSPFGIGSTRWLNLQALSLLPNHFPHSEYLHLLVGGGLTALLLYAGFLTSLLLAVDSTSKRDLAARLAPIFLFAIVGLTEIVWNPATADTTTILVVSLLLSYGSPAATTDAINDGMDGATLTTRWFQDAV